MDGLEAASVFASSDDDTTSKDRIEAKAPTPMQEINSALKECTFGFFHYRMLCTSFFGILCGVFISNTTPYILPNAECDLNMNLLQKGILNAMPFVGMLFSSVIAGFLTDTFGRKMFLTWGFAGITLFTAVSAVSQTYEMLVSGKFFEGVLFAAAFSPVMTFTSEFCHNDYRDRVLLFQSSFQAMGQIILASISWGVLTQNWQYYFFDGYIVLNTWNFYLLIIALFPLTACILYCFLPESPKFLVAHYQYDEARDILVKMYTQNTGKPSDTCPFINIWKDKSKQAIDEAPEKKVKDTFIHQVVTGLHNVKPIFQKPLGPYLALFCSTIFLVMVLYNVIRLWFPQLSTIVENYSKNESASQDLCVILDSYTNDLRMRVDNVTTQEVCVPVRSGAETYINSIILGIVCLLPFFLSGVLVNKVGKKCLLIVAGVLSIGCNLGLRWAKSKIQVVSLFAVDIAMGQTMMSLIQASTIEAFPTSSRTLAISMIMMSGRTGTLFGNIAFPILLDMGCEVPFYSLTGVMICVTLLSFLIPKKKQ